MSLTTSMNNALSGLAAASRGAQVVSSNVANATTEGYGVRVLELSARANTGAGQGVVVDGVARQVQPELLAERRLADAASGESGRLLSAAGELVGILGDPDTAGSLTQTLAAFDSSLALASSRPDSNARLDDVLRTATSLADTLARMTDETQSMRVSADRSIAGMVEKLNSTLQNVDEINGLILRAAGQGAEIPALLDEQQRQIDSIAEIIPLRQIERENGTVALYALSGTTLLDITPSTFEFTQTPTITADMTLASGALSGITLNGRDLVTPGNLRAIEGGALAAEFIVRDTETVEFQTRLDAVAAELVTRFADPSLDTTLAAGSPGLFTDAGSAFDATQVEGLAARISVNTLADPSRGGALWRIREGLGAPAEIAAGDASLLTGMRDAMTDSRSPTVSLTGFGDGSLFALADGILSVSSAAVSAREQNAAFRSARLQTLDDAVRATGVNTDQEMQKLLLIERYYAANAKVIEAVDEMLGLLTRL